MAALAASRVALTGLAGNRLALRPCKPSMRYAGAAAVMLMLVSVGAARPEPSLPLHIDAASPILAVPETSPTVGAHGIVRISAEQSTQITDLVTTLTVPPEPLTKQFLFLWPGLQPQGANYLPIDNGVLQPVLAWGGVCGPHEQPAPFSTWWVSGIYTNTYGHDPNHNGCYGGAGMAVSPGDKLAMHMFLDGGNWVQDITDLRTGEMVSFAIDMQNQAQNHAYFVVESYGGAPVGDVTFTDTVLTFATPAPDACRDAQRGPNDYVSQTYISPDGMHCAVSEIVLRAATVPVVDPQPGP